MAEVSLDKIQREKDVKFIKQKLLSSVGISLDKYIDIASDFYYRSASKERIARAESCIKTISFLLDLKEYFEKEDSLMSAEVDLKSLKKTLKSGAFVESVVSDVNKYEAWDSVVLSDTFIQERLGGVPMIKKVQIKNKGETSSVRAEVTKSCATELAEQAFGYIKQYIKVLPAVAKSFYFENDYLRLKGHIKKICLLYKFWNYVDSADAFMEEKFVEKKAVGYVVDSWVLQKVVFADDFLWNWNMQFDVHTFPAEVEWSDTYFQGQLENLGFCKKYKECE